jgi:soluble lytic murein transglycosylase-like protein
LLQEVHIETAAPSGVRWSGAVKPSSRADYSVSFSGRFAVLAFSCLMTAGFLFGLQNLGYWKLGNAGFHNLTSLATTATNSIRQFVGLPQAPQDVHVFEKEAAMSPSALLDRWDPVIADASHRFEISAAWIKAVMRVESGGRTVLAGDKPITSPAGAVGIMQVMPETYAEMRAQYGLGADPFDPHDNIFAGAAYLRWLQHKYGFPEMFAAYNGGPGRLDAYHERAEPLPKETVNYIASVQRLLGQTTTGRSGVGAASVEMAQNHRHRTPLPAAMVASFPEPDTAGPDTASPGTTTPSL